MNKKIFFLFLAISMFFQTISGADLKKPNRYFEQFKYSEAIPLYLEATKSTSEAMRREATFKLADCYRLTNNVKEARSWYLKAIELYKPEPVQYFYLGQAQRSLGFYNEAEKSFEIFANLQPQDPRGSVYAKFCRDISKLKPLPESVKVKNAAFLNSEFYDFSPVFYKEGVVFVSDRKDKADLQNTYGWTNYGYLNLFSSQPSYFRDFWMQMSKPEKMSGDFNQKFHDGPLCFSSDFRTVFITRTFDNKVRKDKNNYRTNLLQIYYATITDGKKNNYKAFPYNSELYSVGHPAISSDGKSLIFSSDMPGGFGGSDLYMSKLENGAWSKPVNLGIKINTSGNEVFPSWHKSGTLYFSSDGLLGFGGLDIYETSFLNEEWSVPENLREPINSGYDDFGLVMHFENRDGFFSSNRPDGMGADDIYAIKNYSTMVEPVVPLETNEIYATETIQISEPEHELYLMCGEVLNSQSGLPLSGATVFLYHTEKNMVTVHKTRADGMFEARVEKGVLFVAKAMAEGFFDDCLAFRFETPDSIGCNNLHRALKLSKYELNQVFRIDNIYYDLDKHFIRPDARPPLDNLIRIMKQYPINIELSSHTDSRATTQYNQALSQRRAEAATQYLVENGINPARIIPRGYGESKLVNRCADGISCTEAEHQQNRRTEFKITSTESKQFDQKQINLTLFKHGDQIPVQLLGNDFFNECLK